MRKIRVAVAAAVVGISLAVAPAAPSFADDGNGNTTCDNTEICFKGTPASTWSTNNDLQHTFYNGDMNHNNDYLWVYSYPGAITLAYNATGFWNRDSKCLVRLWTNSEYGGSLYEYASLARGYRGDASADRNAGHSRC